MLEDNGSKSIAAIVSKAPEGMGRANLRRKYVLGKVFLFLGLDRTVFSVTTGGLQWAVTAMNDQMWQFGYVESGMWPFWTARVYP